ASTWLSREMISTMPWQDDLSDLFGGYINQQPLEKAVAMMLFVSEDHPEIHQQFLHAIEGGMEAARYADRVVIDIINKSGNRVKTTDDVLDLLTEFRQLYMDRYQETSGKKHQGGQEANSTEGHSQDTLGFDTVFMGEEIRRLKKNGRRYE